MDLKELTAFQTILQEGTFSRAAEKLNYAQSTITNQIQRLEKEIGIQLFKRGWDAELTNAGRIFATEVDKLLRHWNDVAEMARALERDEIGSLRIGVIEPLIQSVLPDSVRRFHQSKPRMDCQISVGSTEALSRALRQHELEFAICGEPLDPNAFYFEPLYEERIVFVADENHPLIEREGVPFKNILAYSLIAGGRSCLYYLQLAKHLSRYEAAPLLHSVNQISAIPYFVQQTTAVGVVLDSTPLPPDIQKIDVSWDASLLPVGFLRLQGSSQAGASARLLMQIVKEELERLAVRALQ
ncbi:DNA-binding transcriptional regulator, LysR family [Paenibacillus sp. UNCCL117]|uniref:LysR substrate-binding domain-containing protein n=1 Tax=unclassified Paenibacillus TaxID=185978 RepID=UPI00088FFF65|nr:MULTISPECIES: LysR family transcriptional regulator [unclassified Paenibacillus]SDD83937.1 DNA-binding transcriptional regulator, LysR family [Paenibacillus sp. cl123]SFW54736.1 DNA-binding transcriptional regulator, LysR family [Paenibacillus sp. UNCCL117]